MILLTDNLYVSSLNCASSTNNANSKSYSAIQVTPTLVNPHYIFWNYFTSVAKNLLDVEIRTVVKLEQNIILP